MNINYNSLTVNRWAHEAYSKVYSPEAKDWMISGELEKTTTDIMEFIEENEVGNSDLIKKKYQEALDDIKEENTSWKTLNTIKSLNSFLTAVVGLTSVHAEIALAAISK
jgi:hypothetical protein